MQKRGTYADVGDNKKLGIMQRCYAFRISILQVCLESFTTILIVVDRFSQLFIKFLFVEPFNFLFDRIHCIYVFLGGTLFDNLAIDLHIPIFLMALVVETLYIFQTFKNYKLEIFHQFYPLV